MSMRNIFKIVLDSNAEAGKLVTARIAGKAAKEALFANPTVLQGVLTSSAVLTAASLADPDTAHGKALHYLGLGMTMDSADEVPACVRRGRRVPDEGHRRRQRDG